MSTITASALRKKFKEIGYKISIKTVSFQDLARGDASVVKVFNKAGKEKPSIYVNDERNDWIGAILLIDQLKHTKLTLKDGTAQTIVFG